MPAMAEAMQRVGYGIELTSSYKEIYKDVAKSAETFIAGIGETNSRREVFRRTIIELRMLKFARLLARQVVEVGLPVMWYESKRATLTHDKNIESRQRTTRL